MVVVAKIACLRVIGGVAVIAAPVLFVADFVAAVLLLILLSYFRAY